MPGNKTENLINNIIHCWEYKHVSIVLNNPGMCFNLDVSPTWLLFMRNHALCKWCVVWDIFSESQHCLSSLNSGYKTYDYTRGKSIFHAIYEPGVLIGKYRRLLIFWMHVLCADTKLLIGLTIRELHWRAHIVLLITVLVGILILWKNSAAHFHSTTGFGTFAVWTLLVNLISPSPTVSVRISIPCNRTISY